MKRFLYLNSDTLSSYMSQIDDGLIKNKIEILKNESERLNSTKALIEGQASADLKILGKGIEEGYAKNKYKDVLRVKSLGLSILDRCNDNEVIVMDM